jgi:phage gp45-like
MTLEKRDNVLSMALGAIGSIYRSLLAQRNVETEGGNTGKIAFLQVKGRGDPDDVDNQEIVQEADIDHVQHYGLESYPLADTEMVIMDCDGGEVSLGERDAVPTGLSDLAQGDVRVYDSASQEILLDKDSKIRITSPVGNIEVYAKAGSKVKLGNASGGTYRAAAYAHNTEAGASKVASGATLNTWTHDVYGDIAKIKTDLDNDFTTLTSHTANLVAINAWILAHPGPVLGPPGSPVARTVVPATSDGINTDVDHSYVSSGSAKVEVEP